MTNNPRVERVVHIDPSQPPQYSLTLDEGQLETLVMVLNRLDGPQANSRMMDIRGIRQTIAREVPFCRDTGNREIDEGIQWVSNRPFFVID